MIHVLYGSAVPAMCFAVRIVVIMKCKRGAQRRLSWISFVINSFDAEIACAYSVSTRNESRIYRLYLTSKELRDNLSGKHVF